MTGRMLTEIERILMDENPDRVLVYGDTNSTLAGALAAAKLHIPIAHVEAGLRSFNMRMPEEINRILTDQVSDLLFCPTDNAVDNLMREGFHSRPAQVLQVGDVMQDAALLFGSTTPWHTAADIPEDGFILSTLHRAENTDDPARLSSIVNALNALHTELRPVVMPLHPRTKVALEHAGLRLTVKLLDPVGYIEMLGLLRRCALVLTDSGGLQKESFFFGKACVTLRDQTEWNELVHIGANTLAGADTQAIYTTAHANLGRTIKDENLLYGGGQAAQRVAHTLART